MLICDREIKITGSLIRIARIGGEKFLFLDTPQPIIEALRNANTRVDLFTFIEKLPAASPKYSFPMEWDNLAALPVTTFDHWWTKQIGFKARNKAKQAEKKGVIVREVPFDDVLVRGIWEIYNETPIRQGRKYPHYGKDLETVYREEATHLDKSIFIGAHFGDTLIGFVKLLVDESKTQAGLLNILSMIKHRDKAPTNALVAQSVRCCAERGIPFLTYSNFSYGNKLKDSLAEFKESNAFQRIEVPRYYVPLTPLGSIGLALGLHRKLIDRVPAPIWNKYRELRAAWYSRGVDTPARVSQEGR